MDKTQIEKFQEKIDHARVAQSELNSLYRETIGLIDSLKNRSKRYMNQMSNIEDGLLEAENNNQDIEGNIKALTKDIKEFNSTITISIKAFSKVIQDLMGDYKVAATFYSGEKGQLSDMLSARKRLLYLDVVIRKFRTKINSLQQMNNILFSFSEELKEVKVEYRDNLILVNSELANSNELCAETIREIELLH